MNGALMVQPPRIPFGDWVADGIRWLNRNAQPIFDGISTVLATLVDAFSELLLAAPPLLLIVLVGLLAWVVRSGTFAIGSVLCLLFVWSTQMWTNAMLTLALVLIATLIAAAVGLPVGVWAARNAAVSAIVRPVLDFMQTMPAFVYLIPAVLFFSIGVVPGMIATIIFALPPGVRMTELGIRQVDAETVEAGHAFGASRRQILRGIQLPLAVPTIMAGINQVIMLGLSMAVIAGMAGAPGLGKEVVAALSTINIAQGVEAGLGVVFIAVFLDRVTAALGNPSEHPTSLMSIIGRRRADLRRAEAVAERKARGNLQPL